jgi:hypothetical protein
VSSQRGRHGGEFCSATRPRRVMHRPCQRREECPIEQVAALKRTLFSVFLAAPPNASAAPPSCDKPSRDSFFALLKKLLMPSDPNWLLLLVRRRSDEGDATSNAAPAPGTTATAGRRM